MKPPEKPAKLPIVFATTDEAALTGLFMIAKGAAAALVVFEDGPSGEVRVQTYFARGHEDRAKEIDEMLDKVVERGGFARVDPAVLTKRGEA